MKEIRPGMLIAVLGCMAERMKHALLNATKRKLSSRKQCNDNNTLYPKTLTVEIQYFQMRKMNQR